MFHLNKKRIKNPETSDSACPLPADSMSRHCLVSSSKYTDFEVHAEETLCVPAFLLAIFGNVQR